MGSVRRDASWLWNATSEEICAVMAQGIRRALREHKRAGNSIAVWDYEQERVVIVPPEQIVVPEDEPDAACEQGTTEEDAGSRPSRPGPTDIDHPT